MVSWKELAIRYNVTNKAGQLASNGGQIVKEWLLSEGVNVNRFPTKRKNDGSSLLRRKKRKGQGGEISVPAEIDQNKLQKKLIEKLETKEYTIGDMIVPRKVRKPELINYYQLM